MSEVTLQELADQYYTAYRLRLDKEAEAEKLKETELELKGRLLGLMIEEKLTVVGAQSCVVRYHRKMKPHPEDWHKIWGYVQSTGEFDLLHKRLTEIAIEDRWEAGIDIPGVGKFPVDYLTVSPLR